MNTLSTTKFLTLVALLFALYLPQQSLQCGLDEVDCSHGTQTRCCSGSSTCSLGANSSGCCGVIQGQAVSIYLVGYLMWIEQNPHLSYRSPIISNRIQSIYLFIYISSLSVVKTMEHVYAPMLPLRNAAVLEMEMDSFADQTACVAEQSLLELPNAVDPINNAM